MKIPLHYFEGLALTQLKHRKKHSIPTKKTKSNPSKFESIVGIHENHLYRIETGRYTPSIITLALISGGLGISIEELCGER
jgi:transcriptional regulator with XRE-family HTH domain